MANEDPLGGLDEPEAPADALSSRGGGSSAMDRLLEENIQTQRRLGDAQVRNLEEREKSLEPVRQEQIKQLRQPIPQPPQQQQLPQAPQRNDPAADEQWLSIAMVLGAIGGGLTRRHTTNALAAMTGALEGYNEGSRQKFDQNLKIWDAESKRILETNKQANEDYRRILESRQLAFEQKAQELQLTAAKYDDRAALQLLQMGNQQKLGDLIIKREQLQEQLAQHTETNIQNHANFLQRERQHKERLEAQERMNQARIDAAKFRAGASERLSDDAIMSRTEL